MKNKTYVLVANIISMYKDRMAKSQTNGVATDPVHALHHIFTIYFQKSFIKDGHVDAGSLDYLFTEIDDNLMGQD